MANLNNTIQLSLSSIIPSSSEKPSSSQENPIPMNKPSSQIPSPRKVSCTSVPKIPWGTQSPSSTKSKKDSDNKTIIIIYVLSLE